MRCPREVPPGLVDLAREQERVVTRQQLLELGLNQFEIRAQLSARRWTAWGAHVVLLHNADLTRRQLMWAGLLDAGEPAALVSHSALELVGFRDFAREAAVVHLMVPRGAKVTPSPGITVHESRRVKPEDHVLRHGLRCTEVPRSALDAAAWQPWPRFACALVAAVVQQRLCTAAQLEEAMQQIGRIRHKAYLREALHDISGGAEALSELDLARTCRRFGLQEPDRQKRRRAADGRWRYLDAEWLLADGRRVVLEVDGAHHLDVQHWQADMRRDRGLAARGVVLLRATALELRLEPGVLVADLLAAQVPRVVRTELTQGSTQF
jgi:hypothetical protein